MSTRVRCASCKRTLAVSDSDIPLRTKVYCDELCLAEPPATPTEERTDQWRWLTTVYGISPVKVGKDYGVAHSQVYKAIKR